jgi:hypothetical protein
LPGRRIPKLSPHFYVPIREISKRFEMFPTTLWLTALTLESVLLVRAIRGNILKQYPFFYLYLSCVLLRDASLMPIYYLWPKIYGYAYWYSEFFSVVVGCGVVWEVYKVALSRYPGAARMARNVLPFLFIVAASRIFVNAWNNPRWLPESTTLEVERDLRILQLVLLLGLAGLIAYYAVPLRRDLKGIIYGFSAFVAITFIHLTFGNSLGGSFRYFWPYVQPMAYLFVLLIWCRTLWSWETAPEVEIDPRLEVDYQSLASATKRQLRAAHGYLLKAIR